MKPPTTPIDDGRQTTEPCTCSSPFAGVSTKTDASIIATAPRMSATPRMICRSCSATRALAERGA